MRSNSATVERAGAGEPAGGGETRRLVEQPERRGDRGGVRVGVAERDAMTPASASSAAIAIARLVRPGRAAGPQTATTMPAPVGAGDAFRGRAGAVLTGIVVDRGPARPRRRAASAGDRLPAELAVDRVGDPRARARAELLGQRRHDDQPDADARRTPR